jgi:hypothetical protein
MDAIAGVLTIPNALHRWSSSSLGTNLGVNMVTRTATGRNAAILLATIVSASAIAASGTYATGAGAVTSWSASPDFDNIRSSLMPVCIYVYQGRTTGANPEGEFLEGASFLNNPDVQKTLKKFSCYKINVVRSDKMPKNLQRDLAEKFKAQKFAVILMSSDMKQEFTFKKDPFGALAADPKLLISTAEKVLKYQEALKAADAKADKAKGKDKEEEIADAGPKTVGGIPGLNKEEKDEKKDDKGKKDDKKIPAAPTKPAGPVDE